jgi:hypothetical protein
MKKLIAALAFFSLTFSSSALAQNDQAEIRLLITEAPVVEAMKKAREVEELIVWGWLRALAYSGETTYALQVAHKLSEWLPVEESTLAIAIGRAMIGKPQEALTLLHTTKAKADEEGEEDKDEAIQSLIVLVTAMSADNSLILAEVHQIHAVQNKDEAIRLAIEVLICRNEIAQAQQLAAHITTEEGRKAALELIKKDQSEKELIEKTSLPKQEELERRPIESLTIDELLALEKVDDAITKAKRMAGEDKRNDLFVSISEHLAKKHNYRQARITANLCTNPLLRLEAYTQILTEFAIQQNPALPKKLAQGLF